MEFQICRAKFNLREGMAPENESLPKRFFDEPLENGDVIKRKDLNTMKSEYYHLRGWDNDGYFLN